MALLANPSGSIVADFDMNIVANLLEQSTMQNLREIQHKDTYGNDIGMSSQLPRA